MIWVYIKTEPGLWTVGFYAPNDLFKTDSDHSSREDAARRVHYLNGGNEETEQDSPLLDQYKQQNRGSS